MRTLVLTRGIMGSGKSTWIKDNDLEKYTISADNIRLLFQSPALNMQGEERVSSKNDGKVWSFIFELLEERMKRGEFTIIDATHAKREAINQYKKIVKKYRYRVIVLDFSDVPLELALHRNKHREEHKFVPEQSIINSHLRMSVEKVPNWVNLVKPKDFNDLMMLNNYVINLSKYKNVHHIGDVHGCWTSLSEFVKDGLKDDEFYIFTGDYIDRGIENAEVIKFLLENYEKENVVLIEGNHEKWLRYWSNNELEEIKSRTFLHKTMVQLEDAEVNKKDVKRLCDSFRQMMFYNYNGTFIYVTHGGIPKPIHLHESNIYLATDELINGVGTYEDDIDEAFYKNSQDGYLNTEKYYQVHGHRNVFRHDIMASKNSLNLEGQVEFGGHLRIATLSKEETNTKWNTLEIKNNKYEYKENSRNVDNNLSVEEYVEILRKSKYVKESKLANGVSSFNFTRKAFSSSSWNDLSVKARGLFINTNTNTIVARSFDKFFNYKERRETKIGDLADNLEFPVKLIEKPNGYLGILGYNEETDELVFCSKSTIHGNHASWFKKLFLDTHTISEYMTIKEFVKNNNVSIVYEVVLPEKDPHIIKYSSDKLYVLEIIKNTIEFEVFGLLGNSEDINAIYNKRVETSDIVKYFTNWKQLLAFLKDSETFTFEEEGYVLKDDSGFMFKLKLQYYKFWKEMRNIKDFITSNKEFSFPKGKLYTPEHTKVYKFMLDMDKDKLKSMTIIQVRDMYEYRNK